MKLIRHSIAIEFLVLAAAGISAADTLTLRSLLPAQGLLAGRSIQKLRPLAVAGGSLVVGGVDAGNGVLLAFSMNDPSAPATVLAAPGASKAVAGGAGQVWGQALLITDPAVDAAGDVAFGVADGAQSSFEQWVWEPGSGQLRAIGKSWINLTIDPLFSLLETPLSVNSGREIAFMDLVASSSGSLVPGIFLRQPDGTERAVAIPGQSLDGAAVLEAVSPSLSDVGNLAFLATRDGQALPDPYIATPAGNDFSFSRVPWDAAAAAGFEPIQVTISRDGKGVLLEGFDSPDPNSIDTSLWIGTTLGMKPLLAMGQALPGGGIFQSLQVVSPLTPWNAQGRFAFLADLTGGGQGLYVGDAQGQLTRIVQSGIDTPLGKLRSVGGLGVALGDDGQMVVGLSFEDGTPQDGLFLIVPPAS